jgi:DNA-binding NarL/FixJ family response regulator
MSAPRSGAPIRVVLGEGGFLAREAISAVLERAEQVELVAVAGDLDGLRSAIARTDPDVVLTDIPMPPDNSDEGIRLAEELRRMRPEIGVVIISQSVEPGHAVTLFERGSDGRAYLLRERVRDEYELVHTLQTVAEGGAAIDPLLVERLLGANRRARDARLESLTPRELEILALLAEGHSNAAIAGQLVLTKRGVERHVNNIFAKLDLGEARAVSRRVKAALVYLGTDELH